MTDIDKQYEDAVSRMHEFRLVLERLIQVSLETEGLQVHSVTSRVKSKSSVIGKLQRADRARSLNDLTDLLGVRIITYFRDEVDTIARLIEREFEIDRENSVDKRAVLDPDRFGYLSLHYVSRLGPSRSELIEYSGFKNIRFELQIRTILQHAWAEIEHDLGYKSEITVPGEARRSFSRLAGLLELADDEFFRLRKELTAPAASSHPRTPDFQSGVERVLARPALISLPAWPEGWTEVQYLAYVSRMDPTFLLMDRVLIEIRSTQSRFEACDLLGPNNELIHIRRRPRNSASFGHLINQALVSAEILINFVEARNALAAAIERLCADRALPPDFRPKDVILAFPSEENPVVPLRTISQFARITLSRAAETLDSQGVTLRVMGIGGE